MNLDYLSNFIGFYSSSKTLSTSSSSISLLLYDYFRFGIVLISDLDMLDSVSLLSLLVGVWISISGNTGLSSKRGILFSSLPLAKAWENRKL